ncbi:hypothetical protein BSKO_12226 [Bryopsis sp. KO-2023]|nr:hypothetical protein BSKO_12226 [Bryopsis sp. KO-2023]
MLLVANGLLVFGVFLVSKAMTNNLVVEITKELKCVAQEKECELAAGQIPGAMVDLLDVNLAPGLEPEGEPSSICFSVEEFGSDIMEGHSRSEASIKARDVALFERAKQVRELQRENDFLEAEAARLKLVAAVNAELRTKANEVHELEEENDDLEEVVDRLDSAMELNNELKETLKRLVEKLKKRSMQKLLSGLTIDDIDEITL